MKKSDIEKAAIMMFGNNLKLNTDYDIINPKSQFHNYSNLVSLNSKFSYLACNGGYEQELNGDLSYQLHILLHQSNNNDYVLKERTYTIQKGSQRFLVNSKGSAVSKSKVDIVSGNISSGLPFNSAIMLGHNYICQSSTTSQTTNFPNFLQKTASELFNLSVLGFQNKFFIALLSDINIHNQISGYEYKYLRFANARNINNGYVMAINAYRCAFRQIDSNFVHLIFKTHGLIGYNADVFLNIFIIEQNCSFKTIEKNGLYYVDIEK